ncbi:TPA_asm: P6 [Peat soil associated betacytorhabdovirus 2]|nr:TPA_asm: P6 [Peat soil associated betacytorhabdovirus 2]
MFFLPVSQNYNEEWVMRIKNEDILLTIYWIYSIIGFLVVKVKIVKFLFRACIRYQPRRQKYTTLHY